VVVTDVTTSGQISLQEVKASAPFFAHRLEFEYLEGLPLSQLQQHLAGLGQDAAVFLFNYFRDTEGNYYSPETVMPEISKASSVPVYCFSEFYINHGATGGLINEGYPHGAVAGQMALNVLAGEDISTMVVARAPCGRYSIIANWPDSTLMCPFSLPRPRFSTSRIKTARRY
jgi:hypothetical protein